MKRRTMRFLLAALALLWGGLGEMIADAGEITLSGMTMWQADASGMWLGHPTDFWNTIGAESDGDTVSNIYFFNGSPGSPSFITSGDSDSSLNPNINLVLGTNVIQFAGNNNPGSSNIGINLFFNNDLSNNRISAMVLNNGTNNFSVIPEGTNSFGESTWNSAPVPSSGLLSYTFSDLTVTLSNFSVMDPTSSPDLVSAFSLGPGGALAAPQDTIGSLTHTVTSSVPEPSTLTSAGIAVLVGLACAWRRRRCV